MGLLILLMMLFGWKWDDIRVQVQKLGLSDKQTDEIDGIVTAKKWELVDILEGRVKDALAAGDVDFQRGRVDAFREVIDGVKPHGKRP